MPDPYPHRCLLVAAVSRPTQAGRYARRIMPVADDQDDKLSIDNQLAACRAKVAEHAAQGWTVAGEIVIPGHSRNYTELEELCSDCPEYAEFIARVRGRQCTLVIVAADDRLWRTVELGVQVQTVLWRNGVQLGDCSHWQEPLPPEQIKPPKALEKLAGLIKVVAAEIDNEKRQSRARPNQISRIVERGLPIANGHYGYRSLGNKLPPQQVPEEVAWLRWMYERRLERWGYCRIAMELQRMGVRSPWGRHWSRTEVRALLTNPFYAGELRWGPARGRGQHEPVWSPEEWAALQAINRELGGDHSPRRIERELTGLCRCMECGWRLVYRVRPDGRPTLRCNYERNGGNGMELRHRLSVFVDDAVAQIIARVQAELADPDAWIEARRAEIGTRQSQSLEAVEAELRRRRTEWERWSDAYAQGVIDAAELRERRAMLQRAIDALERERAEVERAQAARNRLEAQLADLAAGSEGLRRLLEALPGLPWQDRRRVWLQVIAAAWFGLDGRLDHIEWRGLV